MHKAVIFDFDGTLADTMEDNFQAWKETVLTYGVFIDCEDYFPFEGMGLQDLIKKYKVPETAIKEKELYYLANHKFRLYPGVLDLVGLLSARKIPLGIVTAGLRDRIDKSVPQDFLDKFKVIVSGAMKPDPGCYLQAIKNLNVEECIVVENAPLGIRSAKSAGAYCIAICSTLGREHLVEADEVLDSFDQLINSATIKKLIYDQL